MEVLERVVADMGSVVGVMGVGEEEEGEGHDGVVEGVLVDVLCWRDLSHSACMRADSAALGGFWRRVCWARDFLWVERAAPRLKRCCSVGVEGWSGGIAVDLL